MQETIVGRWSEDVVDRKIEFTSHHLYAIFTNGERVDVGLWSINRDGDLVFDSIIVKKRTVWKCAIKDDTLTVDAGVAFERKLVRMAMTGEIFDKRLQGLWRLDGKRPEIVEFTAQGTFVGLFQRLDDHKKLMSVGCLGEVARASSDEFYLEGYLGDRKMTRTMKHKFTIDKGKLIWGRIGGKRTPKTYRPIKLEDIAALPAEAPEAEAPTATAPQPSGAPAVSR